MPTENMYRRRQFLSVEQDGTTLLISAEYARPRNIENDTRRWQTGAQQRSL